MQSAMTLPLSAQLMQEILDVLGKLSDATSRCAILENRVHPQRPKHLDQM